MTSIHGKHLLRISDLTADEVRAILKLGHRLKADQKANKPHRYLEGKTVALVFEKPSTRTRVSFEVGTFQLGGHALYLQGHEIGLGKRESIADVARTFSRFVNGVMIRANSHWMLEEFAARASVPVINGLSDHHHPCQALADVLTLEERFGDASKVKLCYIGDGNNVCNSLIEICDLLGISLVISCPEGYDPLLRRESEFVKLERDPQKAAKGADAIYTDVWISMGQEASERSKIRDFLGYGISSKIMKQASSRAIFMHCLPAHPGLEVEEEVLESAQSVVFDQAENRLHAQKAVLALLAGTGAI